MAYRERVRWPGWFLLGVACIFGGALALVGAGLVRGGAILVGGLLPLAAAGYVIWRMRHIELEFGPDGAGFGFGRVTRRVPRERILLAEPAAYPVARFMGWGYRLGWQPRERAYSILGCPRGIRLRFLDEEGREWTVFLSSRDPEAAVAALTA